MDDEFDQYYSNVSLSKENQPSSGISTQHINESEIDRLTRINTCSLSENQGFYIKLTLEQRQQVISDVLSKWPALDSHSKTMKFDMLSNSFTTNRWFKQFCTVINEIRVDDATRKLRTRVYQH